MNKKCSLLAALLVSPALAQDNPVERVEDLTLQWTRLEQQRELLQANWRADQPILEQQLALLEREAGELDDFLAEYREEQDEVEARRLELLEQQTRLEREQGTLEQALRTSAIRLQTLQPQLPPPLRDAWAEELPRFDDPLATASEKLQLVLELLGQLDDFQQRLTLDDTVMTLDDGQQYFVQQVYVGLSHGWYVTADQRIAAAGTATPTGWQWSPSPDATRIAQIIGILERRLNPELVSIPLDIGQAGSAVD